MNKVLFLVQECEKTEPAFLKVVSEKAKSAFAPIVYPLSDLNTLNFGKFQSCLADIGSFSYDNLVVFGDREVSRLGKALALIRFYEGTISEIFKKRLNPFRALPYELYLTSNPDGTEASDSLTMTDPEHGFCHTLHREDLKPVKIHLVKSMNSDLSGLCGIYLRCHYLSIDPLTPSYLKSLAKNACGFLDKETDEDKLIEAAQGYTELFGALNCSMGSLDYLADIVCGKGRVLDRNQALLTAYAFLYPSFDSSAHKATASVKKADLPPEIENILREKSQKAFGGLYFRG